jgi:hypothetical protein
MISRCELDAGAACRPAICIVHTEGDECEITSTLNSERALHACELTRQTQRVA